MTGLLAAAMAASAGAQTVLVDQTSATFAWEPATGPVEFYEVHVARVSTGGQPIHEQTVAAGPAPSVTLDAGPGEILSVSVVAGNEAQGTGSRSQGSTPVRFATSPPRPPIGGPGVVSAQVSATDSGAFFYAEPATGDVWRYRSDAPTASPTHVAQEFDEDWEVRASGDFNGDGEPDLFWHNTADDRTRMWLLNPAGYDERPTPPHPGLAWRTETTGDFDGNGQDDLYWRSDQGPTRMWLSQGEALAAVPFPSVPDAGWTLLSAGDFDADGLDDLFWRNSGDSQTAVWFTTLQESGRLLPQFALSARQSLAYEVFESYDRNGDGTDDLHWRRVADGAPDHWWDVYGGEVETVYE